MYTELDAGRNEFVSSRLARAVDPADTAVSFNAMSTLMDVASGTNPNRRELIEKPSEKAIVAPHLNGSMPLATVDPSLDLGEAHINEVVGDIGTRRETMMIFQVDRQEVLSRHCDMG